MSTCSTTASRMWTSRRNALVLVWFVFVTFCTMWISASKSHGQAPAKYEVMEYQPAWFTDKSIISRIKQIRGQIIGDSSQLEAQKTFFVQIYTNIFASMTDPNALHQIAGNRALVMKDIDTANRRGNPVVSRGLTQLAYGKCLEIAKGNYHPTSRINAILMIGALNDREMNSLKKMAPIAYQAALDPLVEFIGGDDYNDGIRVAAMQGVKRHIALNSSLWQPAKQDQIADLLLTIAESDPPSGRQPEAHGWMQAVSIDMLLSLNNPRRADKVATVVVDMATKPEASDHILVRTAQVAPNIQPPKDFTPKTDLVVVRWAQQMAASIAKEAKRIEVAERERPASSMMMGGEVDMGDLMYDEEGGDEGGEYEQDEEMYGAVETSESGPVEQTKEILRARRMLNYILESFHLGLSGTRTPVDAAAIAKGLVAITSDAEQKEKAQELLKLVDLAAEGVNDATIGKNLDYAVKLRTIEQILLGFVDPNLAVPDSDGPEPPPFMFPGGEPFGAFEPEAPTPAELARAGAGQ